MKRKLLLYPDPHLRKKAHEVRVFDDAILPLVEDMRRIMHENNGMGLAANQIGDDRQIIIVEYPGVREAGEAAIPFTILVNPRVTNRSKSTTEMQEGCLSIPSVEIPIVRHQEITVMAQNAHGQPVKIRAKGMFSRILQHEIDHLNGKLILDYAESVENAHLPKCVVWGSTEFTTTVLNTLLADRKITLEAIVTEAPKVSGRGQSVIPTIVHNYSEARSIRCIEPTNLSDDRLHSYLASLNPDVFIVASYGRLLPKEILAIPKFSSLNIHPSLLPLYRGASPIQYAILNGDQKTGVTLMVMDPSFDTGMILAQSELELDGTETFGDLVTILAELGGEIINTILPLYIDQSIKPIPQNANLVSHAPKIERQDRWLNLEETAETNERRVRAFNPSPGAFVIIDRKPIKILEAHIENGEIVFDRVQPPGKQPMTWDDFKRGYRQAIHFNSLSELET